MTILAWLENMPLSHRPPDAFPSLPPTPVPFPPISFCRHLLLRPPDPLSTLPFNLSLLNTTRSPLPTTHPSSLFPASHDVAFRSQPTIPFQGLNAPQFPYHQPMPHQFHDIDEPTQLLPLKWRFNFPKFFGDDPHDWLHSCEEFFYFHATPKHLKVYTTGFNCEGEASQWIRYQRSKGPINSGKKFASL